VGPKKLNLDSLLYLRLVEDAKNVEDQALLYN
jgi:hypothetical protein